MIEQQQTIRTSTWGAKQAKSPSRAKRRLSIALLLAVGALAAVPSITIAAEDDEAPLVTDSLYAAPNRLVEIEPGRRINLHCTGSGAPTIVFDSGLGGGTPAWAPIQPELSKTNRACSYDRAGINFSDPSARASTSQNIVDDLHRTLAAAGIAPPYLLVGHSYGGLNMRLFATTYREEVVGLVLVDPMHEDQSEIYRALDPAKPTAEEWAKQRKPTIDRLTLCEDAAAAGFVIDSESYRTCRIGEPNPLFGREINAAYAKLKLTPGHWRALPSENESVFDASADQVRNSDRSLGDVPLLVLTRSPAPKRASETQAERDERNRIWVDMHDRIAAFSTRGENRIVADSGHAIQFDQPESVIAAIREIVRVSREQRTTE